MKGLQNKVKTRYKVRSLSCCPECLVGGAAGRTCCGCSLSLYCPGCAWAWAVRAQLLSPGHLKGTSVPQLLSSKVGIHKVCLGCGKKSRVRKRGGRWLPRARKERTRWGGGSGEGARGIVYLRYRGTTRERVGYNPLPYNHMQIY